MTTVLMLVGAVVVSAGLTWVVAVPSPAWAEDHYAAHGTVKSFGANRAYVNIAHDRIPGYMEAMTMSFEPRTAEQLAGIDVGVRVAFTFTVTTDGHRRIDRIAKE
jgi:Cu/Ag efflux protein CusF